MPSRNLDKRRRRLCAPTQVVKLGRRKSAGIDGSKPTATYESGSGSGNIFTFFNEPESPVLVLVGAILRKEKSMRTALTTTFAAAMLAASSMAFADDTGGTTTGTNSTGTTTTDQMNTGSVQNPSLSPADQERCKTAPASDTTCQGMNQGTNQQQ
jgi:hypothetical protein